MPSPPLRFLHAANVMLDSIVWLPGSLADAVREAAVTATRTAFRNVVRECLQHDVEFLLLCGNTFRDDERSLAARVALRDGLRQLADAGIPTFVLPGAHDPIDAWRAIPALPELVTVFDGDEPVEVTRDGETIVVVCVQRASEPRDFPKSLGSANGPIRIGVRSFEGESCEPTPACDYLALGGSAPAGTLRSAAGVAHHPGPPQPLLPTHTNGSCTLVEVDASRQFQLTPLATAAIRFEHLRKSLDVGDTSENFLQTLPGQLTLRPAVNGETVRCVSWTIDGDGPLWESLQSPASRLRVECELNAAATAKTPAIVHRIASVRTNADDASTDSLAGEFEQALNAASETAASDIPRGLDDLAKRRPEWKQRLEQLAAHVSAPAVAAAAHHVGRQRLLEPTREGLEA